MKVLCSKCGADAHAKCPWTRTVFPDDTVETRNENAFFHTFSFELKLIAAPPPKMPLMSVGFVASKHYTDCRELKVWMLTRLKEGQAFEQFIRTIKESGSDSTNEEVPYVGHQKLVVSMLTFDVEDTEASALARFVSSFRRIPDESIVRYACKHSWAHTEDCRFCGWESK